MNSVNIIGNIGHDLKLRQTQTGKSVLNLNIAVSDYNDDTEWFKVVIWNKIAENTVKYCSKGSKIGISGRLSTNKFVDKNNQERTNVEIVAQNVEFLSYQNDQSNQQNQSYQPNNQTGQQNNYSGQNSNQQGKQGQPSQPPQTNNDPFEANDDVTDISDDDLPF